MPNITRNAIVNCAELVTYDIIKELILKHDFMTGNLEDGSSAHLKLDQSLKIENINVSNKYMCCWSSTLCFIDNLPCHFTAAFGAGFFTTVVASPVDVVKTRFMNSTTAQYSSASNCAYTMLTKEGPKAFYKGCVICKISKSEALAI